MRERKRERETDIQYGWVLNIFIVSKLFFTHIHWYHGTSHAAFLQVLRFLPLFLGLKLNTENKYVKYLSIFSTAHFLSVSYYLFKYTFIIILMISHIHMHIFVHSSSTIGFGIERNVLKISWYKFHETIISSDLRRYEMSQLDSKPFKLFLFIVLITQIYTAFPMSFYEINALFDGDRTHYLINIYWYFLYFVYLYTLSESMDYFLNEFAFNQSVIHPRLWHEITWKHWNSLWDWSFKHGHLDHRDWGTKETFPSTSFPSTSFPSNSFPLCYS